MLSLEDAIEAFANQQANASGLSLEQYILEMIGFLEKAIDAEITTDIVFAWLCHSYLEQQIEILVSQLDCAEQKAFKKKKASIEERYMLQHICNISGDDDLDLFLEKQNRIKWVATISALNSVINSRLRGEFEVARLAVAETQKQANWLFRATQYPCPIPTP